MANMTLKQAFKIFSDNISIWKSNAAHRPGMLFKLPQISPSVFGGVTDKGTTDIIYAIDGILKDNNLRTDLEKYFGNMAVSTDITASWCFPWGDARSKVRGVQRRHPDAYGRIKSGLSSYPRLQPTNGPADKTYKAIVDAKLPWPEKLNDFYLAVFWIDAILDHILDI